MPFNIRTVLDDPTPRWFARFRKKFLAAKRIVREPLNYRLRVPCVPELECFQSTADPTHKTESRIHQ